MARRNRKAGDNSLAFQPQSQCDGGDVLYAEDAAVLESATTEGGEIGTCSSELQRWCWEYSASPDQMRELTIMERYFSLSGSSDWEALARNLGVRRKD